MENSTLYDLKKYCKDSEKQMNCLAVNAFAHNAVCKFKALRDYPFPLPPEICNELYNKIFIEHIESYAERGILDKKIESFGNKKVITLPLDRKSLLSNKNEYTELLDLIATKPNFINYNINLLRKDFDCATDCNIYSEDSFIYIWLASIILSKAYLLFEIIDELKNGHFIYFLNCERGRLHFEKRYSELIGYWSAKMEEIKRNTKSASKRTLNKEKKKQEILEMLKNISTEDRNTMRELRIKGMSVFGCTENNIRQLIKEIKAQREKTPLLQNNSVLLK
jgi:hypothetical protein